MQTAPGGFFCALANCCFLDWQRGAGRFPLTDGFPFWLPPFLEAYGPLYLRGLLFAAHVS
jgi:hypothetical protein